MTEEIEKTEVTEEIAATETVAPEEQQTTEQQIEFKDAIEENASLDLQSVDGYDCKDIVGDIHDLLVDPDFIQLCRNKEEKTLFNIVGMTHTERWYSSFLAWLLNPESPHGLDYFPMRCLLSGMWRKAGMLKKSDKEEMKEIGNNVSNALPSISSIDAGRFENCQIMPNCYSSDYSMEKTVYLPQSKASDGGKTSEAKEDDSAPVEDDKNEKKIKLSFDVSFTVEIQRKNENQNSNKENLFFICENKVKSNEGDNQTTNYYNWLTSSAKFPLNGTTKRKRFKGDGSINNSKYALLFLTPDGRMAQSEEFLPYSYEELMADVLIPCMRHANLSAQGQKLLREFVNTLDSASIVVSERNKLLIDSILKKENGRYAVALRAMLRNLLCEQENISTIEAQIHWLGTFLKVEHWYLKGDKKTTGELKAIEKAFLKIALKQDWLKESRTLNLATCNTDKRSVYVQTIGNVAYLLKLQEEICCQRGRKKKEDVKVITFWEYYKRQIQLTTDSLSYLKDIRSSYKDSLETLCDELKQLDEDKGQKLLGKIIEELDFSPRNRTDWTEIFTADNLDELARPEDTEDPLIYIYKKVEKTVNMEAPTICKVCKDLLIEVDAEAVPCTDQSENNCGKSKGKPKTNTDGYSEGKVFIAATPATCIHYDMQQRAEQNRREQQEREERERNKKKSRGMAPNWQKLWFVKKGKDFLTLEEYREKIEKKASK